LTTCIGAAAVAASVQGEKKVDDSSPVATETLLRKELDEVRLHLNEKDEAVKSLERSQDLS